MDFLTDFMLGGVSGAIAKTCTAPIERVKLIIQARALKKAVATWRPHRTTVAQRRFLRPDECDLFRIRSSKQ